MFRNKRTWPKPLLKVIVGLALAGAVLLLWRGFQLGLAGALCRSPVISDPAWKSVKLAAGPCWEYWLYRYQTLLSAVVAAFAIVSAWWTFRVQIASRAAEQNRDFASTTLRLLLEHSRLEGMVDRVRPELVKGVVKIDHSQIMLAGIQIISDRIGEARRVHERFASICSIYRASDFLRWKVSDLNIKIYVYLDALDIYVFTLSRIAIELPKGALPQSDFDVVQSILDGISNEMDSWKRYKEARSAVNRDFVNTVDKYKPQLTREELAEIARVFHDPEVAKAPSS